MTTKQRRRKQARRQHHAGVAHFEIVTPGCLEVLSVGKGDLKLTVGGDDPEDTEKARALITEMLRKGYGIFVETDKGLTRVKRFNPKRMTYVISEIVEDALPAKEKPRRVVDKHVPVAGSKATAIGRTSGG